MAVTRCLASCVGLFALVIRSKKMAFVLSCHQIKTKTTDQKTQQQMTYLTVNKQGYNYLNNQYTCTLYSSSTKTIKNQYISI